MASKSCDKWIFGNKNRNGKNRPRTHLGLRTRLAVSTALATIVLGGYGGRKAYAACTGAAGTYTCSDALLTTQTLPTAGTPVLNVTTDSGFSINTAEGNAFTLTGTGGLTFTDNNYSTITGNNYGIDAHNHGSGALSIATNGPVEGKTIDGIHAYNSTSGTDLTINTAAVAGGDDGIFADNMGTGSLSITTEAVTGGDDGIRGLNHTGGALSITSTDTVTGNGDGDGINAYNDADGTSMAINSVAVTGADDGIRAINLGSGALSITSNGPVTGIASHGIFSIN